MNRRQFGRSVLIAVAGTQIVGTKAPAEVAPTTTGASPNLSVMLWTILPNEQMARRVAAVAAAGYRSIELVNEFEHWTSADFGRFRQTCSALSVSVDAICVDRIGVANPATSADFLRELSDRIATAEMLECRDIIVLSGKRVAVLSRAQQRQASIDTLKRGGDLAAKRGRRLLLESLDPEEAPDWFLNSVTEGFDIVRAVGNPHVQMLYDFYHEQISGGNLLKKLTENIDLLGLVHIADVPGRHEPGTGEINYRTILRVLAQHNFTGFIAMEFLPIDAPVQRLRAAREYAEAAVKPDAAVT